MTVSQTAPQINDPRLPKSFWEKVHPAESGCWLWSGATTKGYGMVNPRGSRGPVGAHRFAYEALVGPVPSGLQCDHLCRVTACVNPAHIEAVTQKENILRGVGVTALNAKKSTCLRGHPFAPDPFKPGARRCLECVRVAARERKRAFRATPEGLAKSRLWNREYMRRVAASIRSGSRSVT